MLNFSCTPGTHTKKKLISFNASVLKYIEDYTDCILEVAFLVLLLSSNLT